MDREYALIDSHKLAYHPEWVKRWLQAQGNWELARTIYPLYVELSPVGQCNHRCPWCAVDYIGYKNRQLKMDGLDRMFQQMTSRRREHSESWNGVKSVMFAGEGEPTLHPQLAEAMASAKRWDIDVALTTNGTGLTRRFAGEGLRHISWIKASLDAATPETHAINHHASKEQFALAGKDKGVAQQIGRELARKFKGEFTRILLNISHAVEVNQATGSRCMIGAQLLMNPTNLHEVVPFVQLMRDIGCDYCVIKPYSQHNYSLGRQDALFGNFTYRDALGLSELVQQYATDSFGVVFRAKTMENYEDPDRHYAVCQSTPMAWGYVMATGEFVSCSAYLPEDEGKGDQRFVLGSIHSQSFRDIWEGDKRKSNWEFVNSSLDIAECRKNCRMHAVNQYLWGLRGTATEDIPAAPTKTPPNINFI